MRVAEESVLEVAVTSVVNLDLGGVWSTSVAEESPLAEPDTDRRRCCIRDLGLDRFRPID